MRRRALKNGESVAASLRSGFSILSPFTDKTPKGEAEGYLTAMLFLAPHTLGGGKTLCPHSTEACRAGCLYHAGRGLTPRTQDARQRRTKLFLSDRAAFMQELVFELMRMQRVADEEGMTLAVRLNGTSDILWEREAVGRFDGGVFDLFPKAVFYDYTRTPAAHRRVPENWKLTFSLADDPLERALEHFAAGRNVAAVVPEDEKEVAGWFALGDATVQVIDGDLHDLRFMDPSPALVVLRPKGRLLRGGPMVRQGLVSDLIRAHRRTA